jgi:serine/threonine protein kinase
MRSELLRTGDPERLGPYRLKGRLGEGGQGVVYLGEAGGEAEGEAGSGAVAVKLLRAGLGHDAGDRARFIRELETAKRVARFCTAAVLDADVDGDHPYIVSEYVPGPSLSEVVRTEGPRDGGVLERLAVGTATALVAIHQAGVVHRDFKPRNVLLGPDGPRVIDFGIARALDGGTITTSGVGVGTPAYMAPEQFRGDRAGPAADVFAWAATMVFASCGRPPFGDDTLAAVSHRVLNEEPDLGELRGPLRELAARCLNKDQALRPSASEVLRTLLGEHDPRTADPLPPATLQAAAEAGQDVPPPQAQPSSPTQVQPLAAAQPSAAPQAPPRPSAPPWPDPRPVPSGRERHGVPPVVAVSAAVIAVAVSVMVTVLVMADFFPAGGEDPSSDPSGAASGTPAPSTATTAPQTAAAPAPTPEDSSVPPDHQDPPDQRDPADLPGFPDAFAGSWAGQMRQNDGKEFPVEIVLSEGERQGRISYPQHHCSGTVTLIGNPRENDVALHEKITNNATACVDAGTVTLTRQQDDTLYFSYTGTGKGRTWTVEGTLSRA